MGSIRLRLHRGPPLTSAAMALSLIALPSPASARDGAWYVGGDFGGMIVEDVDLVLDGGSIGPSGAIDLAYDYGFDGGLFVGYDFGAFRLEAEVAYKEADLDRYDSTLTLPGGAPPGLGDAGGGSTSALSFMINGMLDFGDDDGFSGFLGGGAGVARIDFSNLRAFTNAEAFIDDSDTRFAWQLVAGLRQAITSDVDVHVRYRFFNVEDVQTIGFGDRDTEGRFRSHSLLGGLTFNFGGGDPPPQQPPTPGIEREQARNRQHLRDHVILQASGGYGSLGIPRAGYGFIRTAPGEPDLPAAFSEPRGEGIALAAGVELPRIGRLTIGYREGEASNRTDLPVSTTGGAQGTVNTRTSPGGSTGGTANRGLGITTEVNMTAWSVEFRHTAYEPRRAPAPEEPRYPFGPIRVSAGYVELSADYRDREHSGVVDIPGLPAGTPPVIRQVLDQEVTEFDIGLAVGAEVEVPIGDDARLTFGVQGGIKYYDHGFDSTQTNTQLVGGPLDSNFTLGVDGNESGFTYHGDAIAEASVRLGGSFEFFVRGQIGIDGDRAQLNNPFSGTFVQNGGTVFLGTDDAVDYTALAGFRIAIDWDR